MDVYFGANVHIISFSPKKVIKKMHEISKKCGFRGVFRVKAGENGVFLCVFNVFRNAFITSKCGQRPVSPLTKEPRRGF